MNKKKIVIIFTTILIFAIGIGIRIYKWPNIVGDINCDEAILAINAKSIAQSGRDMYGTLFPVYFESWLIGGQSALPTYLVSLLIEFFGYNLFSIRFPILLFSILSLFIIYSLTKKIFNEKVSIIVLLLTAISPWQLMQSEWNLDCNLFPHIILIAIYLLYNGIAEDKKSSLYFSMLFFALSMYCYGISVYFTTIFLLITAIYCILNKKISWKQLILCMLIYIIISIPIYLMYVINFLGLESISIFGITIQRFEYVGRATDMLIFSENIIEQFLLNIKTLFELIFLQDDKLPWNRISWFGTIYLQSIIFVVIAFTVLTFVKGNKEEKNNSKIIIIWLGVSLLVGILINGVNINRLNIIWYPLIILTGYGIYYIDSIVKCKKTYRYVVFIIYALSFVLFIVNFYGTFKNEVSNYKTFSKGLIPACEFIKDKGADNINISEKAYKSDKQYVFIKYVYNNSNKFIGKEELLSYYTKGKKNASWFNTESTNFKSENLLYNTNIEGKWHLILESEKEKISNINQYNQYKFNEYLVLIKKD